MYSAQTNPQIDDEISKKCRFRTGTRVLSSFHSEGLGPRETVDFGLEPK